MDMALQNEIGTARKEIVSDGYDMSIGELASLYERNEIVISPAFQRLFRWDPSRKTRFIESLLLGIPTPPIFVYQDESGVWELIDGLQRLSTIFEFMGILIGDDDQPREPLRLEGTTFLPSLSSKVWNAEDKDTIGKELQLSIKRARMRVEILKQESHPQAKYELFQRLNTGGASLSEQEVRNCIAIMLNPEFYDWLSALSEETPFQTTISQTERALAQQSDMELALRFFAFRRHPYTPGLNVHEYLDEALIKLATDNEIDLEVEAEIFRSSFALLYEILGDDSFKKWDGNQFGGKFLMSRFEVISTGISTLIAGDENNLPANDIILNKIKALEDNEIFQRYSGAGISGSERLKNLLPLASDYFING